MSQGQTAIEQRCGLPLTTLSEDEQMFRSSVREFAEGEVRPRVAEMDEHAKLDPALIRQCFDLGLMSIETPEEFGGAAASFFTAILAVEELSRVDASVGVLIDVQNTLVNNALIRWGNPEQKERYLPQLASGAVGAYALSEAGSGSDAFAMQTRALDKGDHYLINGQKLWITNGNEAEIFILFANANPEAGYRGITAFIVEKGFSGFSVGKKENKLGIRASSTTELILDGCKVPKENLLGPLGKGLGIAYSGLMSGRLSVAAGCLGVIEDCITEAVNYSKQRIQHGKPIGKHQLVQRHIGIMSTNLEAAKNLVYKAALLKQHSDEQPENKELRDHADITIAQAKYFASNASFDAADRTVQIFGSSGYSFETRAPRHLVDTRVCRIYEGTDEIMVQKIAVNLLGQDFEAYR